MSQNYTVFGSTDIWWDNSHDSSTEMDSCRLIKTDKKKVKGEGLCSTEEINLILWTLAVDKRTSANLMV